MIHWRWSATALVAIAGAACSTKTRPDRPAVMEATGVAIPPEQLRVRTMHQGAEVIGLVEVAADEILAGTGDPVVRQNALLWKANMLTAVEGAVIRFDPLIAFADLYALCIQADDFFRTGAGATLFGTGQEQATRATAMALSGMRDLTREYARDSAGAARMESYARRWAEANPIPSLSFARRSMTIAAAAAITGSDMSTFAAIGRIEQHLGDLNARVTMLMGYMPKQVRWEAQLLTEQMLGRTPLDTVVANMGTLTRAFERFAAVIESLPGLTDAQRRAMMEGIAAERAEVLRTVTAERIATMTGVSAEVTRMLAALTEERIAGLRDIEGILARTVEHSQATVNASIDHLVWRLAQLMAGLVAVVAIGLGILVFALRPRGAHA